MLKGALKTHLFVYVLLALYGPSGLGFYVEETEWSLQSSSHIFLLSFWINLNYLSIWSQCGALYDYIYFIFVILYILLLLYYYIT